jgi:hypothetical protein
METTLEKNKITSTINPTIISSFEPRLPKLGIVGLLPPKSNTLGSFAIALLHI